ncbi:angiotensin-converting enzyme-like [Pollicipes pollicipes]|uniref:angiotensin-converting enzyme-like n=1 Tax=Pollicipes pollicipes TaxID=41117 RepID=UPI001884CA35|nr:angiotensin-converting enzyme-like [Pollicipes pollicipes]
MQKAYNEATICDKTQENCKLRLEPDLKQLMATERDPKELARAWTSWRDSAGKPLRQDYLTLVQLHNEAAKLNGFADGTELWLSAYGTPDFQSQIARLWDQLTPLYEQLHAFVRGRLRQEYGEDVVSQDGPIPAHLLGDMWSENWRHLLDICKPYPKKTDADVTPQMEAQGYTAMKMFQTAETFVTSMGLQSVPPEVLEPLGPGAVRRRTTGGLPALQLGLLRRAGSQVKLTCSPAFL